MNKLSSSVSEYNTRKIYWANSFRIPELKGVWKQKAMGNIKHYYRVDTDAYKPWKLCKLSMWLNGNSEQIVFDGVDWMLPREVELVVKWTGLLRGWNLELFEQSNILDTMLLWFQLHGTMRVIMKPLVNKLPIIGGYTFFFLNQPVGVSTGMVSMAFFAAT